MKKIIIFILSFLLIIPFACAENKTLTKKDLEDAFQKIKSDEQGLKKVTVEDNVIKMDVGYEKTYSIVVNYDLTDKPKFSYSFDLNKGISYETYQENSGVWQFPIVHCYAAVAVAYGIAPEDAYTYIYSIIMAWSFEVFTSSTPKYIIIDDSAEYSGDLIAIKQSEFGNHVLEYASNDFDNMPALNDNQKFKTFNNIFEHTLDDSKYTFKTTLTIDSSKDFTPINGAAKEEEINVLGKDLTEENADYVVKLKVGQKVKFVYDRDVFVYRTIIGSSLEFDYMDSNTTAEAVSEGIQKIKLMSEDGKESTYIYVIIDANPSGEKLNDYVLDLTKKDEPTNDPTPKDDNPQPEAEPKKDAKDNQEEVKKDKNNADKEAPNTGSQIPAICIITLAIGGYAVIKYTKRKTLFR